jgi:hypothetical protein
MVSPPATMMWSRTLMSTSASACFGTDQAIRLESLSEQPIFYPVTNHEYATQITRIDPPTVCASMCPANCHHLTLVTLLTSLGFVSAYHTFFGEEQGQELRPTLYFQWNKLKPFHIDYCFLPGSWVKQIARIEVGGYNEWKGLSDHRPLVVDIDLNCEEAADPEAGGIVTVR